MMRSPRFTLTWRLFALGIAQLAVFTCVFILIGVVFIGPPRGHHPPAHFENPPPPPPPPPGAAAAINALFISGVIIVGGGALFAARSIVRPVRHLSQTANALGAGDLRARSNIERTDEIGDLSRAFDAMGVRIERLVIADKELLANVSHELRTPLARIRVAVDLATEGDASTQRVSLSEIAVDLAELEMLVDDILTATRLELSRGVSKASQFELRISEVRALTLCERAAERFRSRYPTRALDIVAEGDHLIDVDPVLFRRVLDNLLDNAHKYSAEDASPVTLRLSRHEQDVMFEVEDHGIGIANEDVANLFTPFFRSDRSRTRGTGGVGLGLTLAKGIVEAHGGTISVVSELHMGTRVTVSVPVSSNSEAT